MAAHSLICHFTVRLPRWKRDIHAVLMSANLGFTRTGISCFDDKRAGRLGKMDGVDTCMGSSQKPNAMVSQQNRQEIMILHIS
jgi:hypothetical protein